jgi:hypothetical protein
MIFGMSKTKENHLAILTAEIAYPIATILMRVKPNSEFSSAY